MYYVWKSKKSPPPPQRKTISCRDGNVKANHLLRIIRSCSKKFFERSKYLTERKIKLSNVYPGAYYAAAAGQFANFKTTIDGRRQFLPGDYTFGRSSVNVTLTEDERLVVMDDELKDWITEDLKLKVIRWDLPYRGYKKDGKYVVGIDDILQQIRSKVWCETNQRFVPDNELGTIQLYCVFPDALPLGDAYLKILRTGQLHKFLDFFNALIFGVEGSRNYTVFYTGLIALINMREGSSPAEGEENENQKEEQITYDDLLDLFPMAVTGTGSGNFIMEKALHFATEMAERNHDIFVAKKITPVGFGFFRDNFQWLRVTIKSAVLVYNDLQNQEYIYFAKNKHARSF